VPNGCEDRRRRARNRQLLSYSDSEKKVEHWVVVLLRTLTPLFKAITAM
jgi:hypothetical protein